MSIETGVRYLVGVLIYLQVTAFPMAASAMSIDEKAKSLALAKEESGKAAAQPVQQVPEPEVISRVLGIIGGGGAGLWASVETPDGKIAVIAQGSSIGNGWRVLGIDRDGVTVQLGKKSKRYEFGRSYALPTGSAGLPPLPPLPPR